MESRLQSKASACGICGGQSCFGRGLSLSTSTFPCEHHPTTVPYPSSFITDDTSFQQMTASLNKALKKQMQVSLANLQQTAFKKINEAATKAGNLFPGEITLR
jgi:hypothetical protein